MQENNVTYTNDELEVLAQSRFGNEINIIRHAYVDIAGDLIAGALLGQILYWFEPNKQGKTKLRVIKDGHYWLVKERSDWFDEIRISVKQYDRAAKVLDDKNLIVRKKYKFNGNPMIHIRPNFDVLNSEIRKWLDKTKEEIKQSKQGVNRELPKGENPVISSFNETTKTPEPLKPLGITQTVKPELPKGENGNCPKGNSGIDLSVTLLTETTTETTTKTTNRDHHQENKQVPQNGKPVKKHDDDEEYIQFRQLFIDAGSEDIKRHDIHYPKFKEAVKEIGIDTLTLFAQQYIDQEKEASQICLFLGGGFKSYQYKPKKQPNNNKPSGQVPAAQLEADAAYKEVAATVEQPSESWEQQKQAIADKLALWESRKQQNANSGN